MTVQFEGGLRWPKHEPSMMEQLFGPEEAERMRKYEEEHLDELRRRDNRPPIEERITHLIENWRDDQPQMTHPGDWRPSRRRVQVQCVVDLIDSEEGRQFYMDWLIYKNWLGSHMIVEPGPASMVQDVLIHPERGNECNLRHIVFTDPNWLNTARMFEQEYLCLEPLPVETDSPPLEDDGLRICDEGLYGPYDKELNEHHGGHLPIEPVAAKLLTTPEELNRRLSVGGIDDKDELDYFVHPWALIRLDNYLLMARPHFTDSTQLIVGPVRELSPFGAYLLEELLRTYEYGMAAR